MRFTRGQAGFTLIEVLVASAIVISSIGVILQLFNSGLTGLHKSGSAQHLILAQRQLYQMIQIVDLNQETEQSGNVVGMEYHWVAEPQGERHFLPANDQVNTIAIQLYLITVTLKDGVRERQFQFSRFMHQLSVR